MPPKVQQRGETTQCWWCSVCACVCEDSGCTHMGGAGHSRADHCLAGRQAALLTTLSEEGALWLWVRTCHTAAARSHTSQAEEPSCLPHSKPHRRQGRLRSCPVWET